MTYDDWKTTDTSAADYCSNGHYHCPLCPMGEGTSRAHPCCECDHDSEDIEPSGNPGQLARCTWVLATTGRCTNPATNGDVCGPCEDARDKRRD